MAITRQIIKSQSYTKTVYTIDPFVTSNGTQTTAFSVALPAGKAASCVCEYVDNNSTSSNASGGFARAVFYRPTGGNVARTSANSSQGLFANLLGNFTGAQPSVDIVANVGTQSIDLKVTGKAATSISWHLELVVYMSN